MASGQRYRSIRVLGQGSFGKAILVEDIIASRLCVIKQISIGKLSARERKETEQEASLLASLKHPNIISFIDSYLKSTQRGSWLYIVMEYADGGDLYSLIRQRNGSPIPEGMILDLLVQMCLALKHLHDRKIIHRDLKTENIFLNKAGVLKLGDFGIAKVFKNTLQFAKTKIGTPMYMSPEIFQDLAKYNHKTDMWSLGCIIYEIASLQFAFRSKDLKGLAHKIMKGPAPSIPLQYSRNLRDLVASLFSKDPTLRPEARTILTRPFICDRISNFLSDQQIQTEFSHTILHGFQAISVGDVVRPEPEPRSVVPKVKPAYRNQSPLQFQGPPKALIPRPQIIPGKEKPARRPLHEPKHVHMPKVVGRAIDQQAAKPVVRLPVALRSPKLLAAKRHEGQKNLADDVAKPPDRNEVDSNGPTVKMIHRNAVEKHVSKPHPASFPEEQVDPEIAPCMASKFKEISPPLQKVGFKREGGGSETDAILKIQAQMLQLQGNLKKMGRNPLRFSKGAKQVQTTAPPEEKPKMEDTSVNNSSDSDAGNGISLPYDSIRKSQAHNDPVVETLKVLSDSPTYAAADQEQRKKEFIRFREESRRLLKGEGKLFVELHVPDTEFLAKAPGIVKGSPPVEDSTIEDSVIRRLGFEYFSNASAVEVERTLVKYRTARGSRFEGGGCNMTPSPNKDDMHDPARERRLSREKQREEMRQKIAQDRGKKKSPDHWLSNIEIMVGKLPSPPVYRRQSEPLDGKVLPEDKDTHDDHYFAPAGQENVKYHDGDDRSAISGLDESDLAPVYEKIRDEAGVIFADHMEDVEVEPSGVVDMFDSDDQLSLDSSFQGPVHLEDNFKLVADNFSDAEDQSSDLLLPIQKCSDFSPEEKGKEMSAIFQEAFGICVDGSDEDDMDDSCNDKFTFSDPPQDPEAEPLVYVGRGVVVGGSHASTSSSSHRGAEEEYATMLEQMKDVLKMAAQESDIDEEDEYEGYNFASECMSLEGSDSNASSPLNGDEVVHSIQDKELSIPQPMYSVNNPSPEGLEESECRDSGHNHKGNVGGDEEERLMQDKLSGQSIDESSRSNEEGLNFEESPEEKEETVDPTEVVLSTSELPLVAGDAFPFLGKGSERGGGSREPNTLGLCPVLDVNNLAKAGIFEDLGITESTSTASKIESIRFHLEEKLGLELFLNLYRYIRSVHSQGGKRLSERQHSEVTRSIIDQDSSLVVSLIWNLLELETDLYHY